jgi:hypothetical protein
MEVSDHFHAPAALVPGKEPPVPIGKQTGWTPEAVWTWGEEKKEDCKIGSSKVTTKDLQQIGIFLYVGAV